MTLINTPTTGFFPPVLESSIHFPHYRLCFASEWVLSLTFKKQLALFYVFNISLILTSTCNQCKFLVNTFTVNEIIQYYVIHRRTTSPFKRKECFTCVFLFVRPSVCLFVRILSHYFSAILSCTDIFTHSLLRYALWLIFL